MKIGIVRELFPGERRVAVTPVSVKKIIQLGFSVVIETGAGVNAGYADDSYSEVGAEIANAQTVWASADILLKIMESRT